MKLTASKVVISSMMLCMAKNDVRYYLKGIHFRADGIVEATNGHVLLTGHHNNEIIENFIVSIGKLPTQAYSTIEIDTDSEVATLKDAFGLRVGVTTCGIVDGKFPDTDRLKTDERLAVSEIGFNAGYLYLLERVAKIVNPRFEMVKLEINSATKGTVCTMTNHTEELVMMIMPARI